MDDGGGVFLFTLAIIFGIGGVAGGYVGYDLGVQHTIEAAAKADCEALGKMRIILDGQYQCVTVTP